MLIELRIEDFAIIDSLELKFNPDLVTLTGETGAGKSIILDAIEALVGRRADTALIRKGADRARIEAIFTLSGSNQQAIQEILEREELSDDSSYLTLSRELRREGRNNARINGHSVNVSLMRELGGYLVDIHGQSEHLSLLNVRQHLTLLDRYANSQPALEAYHQVYQKLTLVRRELNDLRKSDQDASRKSELLTFQIREIKSAHLQTGEEQVLRQERDRLANAETLTTLARESLLELDEGVPESPAISDKLGQVIRSLGNLNQLDPSQIKIYERVESLAETISEISRELQDYLDQIEFNPRRLEQVEERLDLINTLKRKYGGSIKTVLEYMEHAIQELEAITHASERITELEEEQKRLLTQIAKRGQELSQLRRNTAESLAIAVKNELTDLNMSSADFTVDQHFDHDPDGVLLADMQSASYDETGLDHVEFLIAPNPGEGFKPLVKIASGGETSRLMLALKHVLARADNIPTLIFDEIDQGIGGRVGAVVGEKLWQLARQHQVLCVTHLPQLAAFGDQHLCVRKQIHSGRTITLVDSLGKAARLDELAHMLGNLSVANRNAAQEALERAQQRIVELTK